ncbi:MAG: nucleoside triphosphate pyrophosphohydrolase [Pseudomonadota bacterium]
MTNASKDFLDEYRDISPSNDIEILLKEMERLRYPETGCSWDVEQTFSSIASYTIEEAYEVKDAIDREDMNDLCDELGDLLLQVVYHSQIAAERGAFTFSDVVYAITKKMIRRHPHVFGTEEQKKNGLMPGDWEKIKTQEKSEKAALKQPAEQSNGETASLLDGVPAALPALSSAVKIQKKAATVGFDWNDVDQVFHKLDEETKELRDEISEGKPSDKAKEELGDVLFVMANIARHLKLDPETSLELTNQKFMRRFRAMEAYAASHGNSLPNYTLAELEALWQSSKQI